MSCVRRDDDSVSHYNPSPTQSPGASLLPGARSARHERARAVCVCLELGARARGVLHQTRAACTRTGASSKRAPGHTSPLSSASYALSEQAPRAARVVSVKRAPVIFTDNSKTLARLSLPPCALCAGLFKALSWPAS